MTNEAPQGGYDNYDFMKGILSTELTLLSEKLDKGELTVEQISRLIEALNSVELGTEGVGNKNPKKILDDGKLQEIVNEVLGKSGSKNKL